MSDRGREATRSVPVQGPCSWGSHTPCLLFRVVAVKGVAMDSDDHHYSFWLSCVEIHF